MRLRKLFWMFSNHLYLLRFHNGHTYSRWGLTTDLSTYGQHYCGTEALRELNMLSGQVAEFLAFVHIVLICGDHDRLLESGHNDSHVA